MAGERATAAAIAKALIIQLPAGGWRHVARVEVDQMFRGRNAVRIVAGRARRLRRHDVLAVTGKTLVGENAPAIMAFVTERVVVVGLDIKIRLRQLPFEQR